MSNQITPLPCTLINRYHIVGQDKGLFFLAQMLLAASGVYSMSVCEDVVKLFFQIATPPAVSSGSHETWHT